MEPTELGLAKSFLPAGLKGHPDTKPVSCMATGQDVKKAP